jgi:nitroimidazol reductase NimA-like FMN-containing flavoprotein (pyridoxamine 5'-phosphate oxidase superfamily)
MTNRPEASYVRFPDEYGDPSAAPMRDWREIEKLLEVAPNYWLASIGPDGRPHVRPVDGVWVEGTLCFGGSPETRWVRNLRANASASINLGSESEAIILEGTAEEISDPSHPLARLSTEASFRKYPQYHPDGRPPTEPAVPFWCFRPSRAFAWTLDAFPRAATRWRFDR